MIPRSRSTARCSSADIAIVEGVDLRDVPAGRYTLWCLPLKIHEGDGGPARVVLVGD